MPDHGDWTQDPFVRVFVTFPDDHPAIWRDDRALAWWLRLLVLADRAYPASSTFPRAVPDDVVEALVAEGVIAQVGDDRYRVTGLARLRAAGEAFAVRGGKARARGPRDALGRLIPSRVDQPGGHMNGAEGVPAGRSRLGPAAAGVQPSSGGMSSPSSEENRPDQTEAQGSSRTPWASGSGSSDEQEATMTRRRTAPGCTDPDAHQARWMDFAGDVRCPVCEGPRPDEPSLRDRIAWQPPTVDKPDGPF